MKKILHVISSPKGDASFSIKLGNAIIEKVKEANPGSTVTENNLAKNPLPHLEEAHLTSFYTPAEQRTPENVEAIKNSDEAVAQLMDADVIVIDAPLYNFSIPSGLKAWVDHIARAGVTFKYDENGPEGLVKGKKVYIALASGGIYSSGPMQGYDFAVPYLKSLLGFMGMTDLSVFRVEGVAYPNLKDTALETAVNSIIL
jgi:FMN-dependent NADH-azoreductase